LTTGRASVELKTGRRTDGQPVRPSGETMVEHTAKQGHSVIQLSKIS